MGLVVVTRVGGVDLQGGFGFKRRWFTAIDRTAAMSLGVVAGFFVGLSFDRTGRDHILELTGFGSGSAIEARTAVRPPPATAADRSRPELQRLLAPAVARRVAASGRIHVGVFGDSYGDGVWSALYRQLPAKAGFDVLQFSKEGTGFTRYRTLDLEKQARRQVAANPIDIAVIDFGANDAQAVYEKGHFYRLLGPEWRALIGARIDRFVAVAGSSGAAVFWVGLPIMKDPTMDADIQAMNAFYAERMKALGVPFVETRGASLDGRGRYSQYLPDSETGTPRLMRANDGVHMSMLGYQRLTSALAARLRDDAVKMRSGRATPVPRPAAPPVRPALAAPGRAGAETARRRERRGEASGKPQPTTPPGKSGTTDLSTTERANRREKKREERSVGSSSGADRSAETTR